VIFDYYAVNAANIADMAVSATTIRTSRATAIAALVLLLTGCAAQTNGTGSPLRTGFAAAPGSGTTPSTPSTPTTPAPPTPTATSVLTGPPSQVTLALAVVRAADLPLGWTPNPSSAASPAGAGCFGDGTTVADRTGVASSTFVNGVAVIAATATGFGAAADVTADAAFVRGPRLVGCLKNVIAGAEVDQRARNHHARELDPEPGRDRHLTATAKFASYTGPIYQDLIYFAGGQLECLTEFVSVATPIDGALEIGVITSIAGRIS
jgi:hypothetical protein